MTQAQDDYFHVGSESRCRKRSALTDERPMHTGQRHRKRRQRRNGEHQRITTPRTPSRCWPTSWGHIAPPFAGFLEHVARRTAPLAVRAPSHRGTVS